MRSVGDWVALVCFVSLALLGWWVLVYGLSWPAVGVGAWWLIVGLLAGIKPGEWQKATDKKRINGSG
jgi:hypothetical protein